MRRNGCCLKATAITAGMDMNDKKAKSDLSKRLSCIAQLVRKDTELIDIGTDHGYLPVSLVLSGKVKKAIAADVAVGPLSKAKKYIEENNLSDRIETVLSDGFENIRLEPNCDAVISGMGGELIAKIIKKEPRLKNESINLILQPMTKADYLREYLSESGFWIYSEKLAYEKKIYQIICCRYTGESYKLSDFELLLGRDGCILPDDVFKCFLIEKRDLLKKTASGKNKAGLDTEYENKMIGFIERKIFEYECEAII